MPLLHADVPQVIFYCFMLAFALYFENHNPAGAVGYLDFNFRKALKLGLYS